MAALRRCHTTKTVGCCTVCAVPSSPGVGGICTQVMTAHHVTEQKCIEQKCTSYYEARRKNGLGNRNWEKLLRTQRSGQSSKGAGTDGNGRRHNATALQLASCMAWFMCVASTRTHKDCQRTPKNHLGWSMLPLFSRY